MKICLTRDQMVQILMAAGKNRRSLAARYPANDGANISYGKEAEFYEFCARNLPEADQEVGIATLYIFWEMANYPEQGIGG